MSTQPTTYLYAVLGLLPGANAPHVNRAYRALLRRHHPDTRTMGRAEQAAESDIALQQILSASAMLGDPAR